MVSSVVILLTDTHNNNVLFWLGGEAKLTNTKFYRRQIWYEYGDGESCVISFSLISYHTSIFSFSVIFCESKSASHVWVSEQIIYMGGQFAYSLFTLVWTLNATWPPMLLV